MIEQIVSHKKKKSFYQQRLDIFSCSLIKTKNTKGREHREDIDRPYFAINPWSLDRAKISRSKALARLPGKTQVYTLSLEPNNFPLNPHIRTRMIHVNEVVALSTIIAETLQLNSDLAGTIALGHDIGQPPFGHNGGRALGLNHAFFGGVIVCQIENGGAGLNLTYEVVEGIMEHSRDSSDLNGSKLPNETKTVILADEIAYTIADWEDLLKLIEFYKNGFVKKIFKKNNGNGKKRESLSGIKELLGNGIENDLPEGMDLLGKNNEQRILSCVDALVLESLEKDGVSFSESAVAKELRDVRSWMYKRVYSKLDQTDERKNQQNDLRKIVEYVDDEDLSGNIDSCSAVGLLTDKEAQWFADILNKREPNKKERQQIETLSMREIVRSLNGKEIDCSKNPLWKV